MGILKGRQYEFPLIFKLTSKIMFKDDIQIKVNIFRGEKIDKDDINF